MRPVELAELDAAVADLKERLSSAVAKRDALKIDVRESLKAIEASQSEYERCLKRLANIRAQDLVDLDLYQRVRDDIANCVDWVDQFQIEHAQAVSKLKQLGDQISHAQETLQLLVKKRMEWGKEIPFVVKTRP